MSDAPDFHQTLQSSMRLAVCLSLLHLLAILAVCAAAMPWLVRLPILLGVMASLSYYLARDVLQRLPDSWHEIRLVDQTVSVVQHGGLRWQGQISGESFVSRYFVVLCARPDGRRLLQCRVIFPDALGAAGFRELCVYLKFM